MKEWLRKGKEVWSQNQDRIIISIGILLVGVFMFEAGVINGVRQVSAPIVIEKPVVDATVCSPALSAPAEETVPGKITGNKAVLGAVTSQGTERCRFVGSKNSTLYHLPSCAPAKRIKSKNLVCFTSEEDARARGYRPGCLK